MSVTLDAHGALLSQTDSQFPDSAEGLGAEFAQTFPDQTFEVSTTTQEAGDAAFVHTLSAGKILFLYFIVED